MDRLIAQYTVPVGSGDTAPATGTPGQATSGNPATNTPATRLPAYAWNAIQEELIAVLTAAGIVPDRTNNAQIATAIRRLVQAKTVLADTGSVNAYVAANAPALTALPNSGFVQTLTVANTNTGASTYAPDGLAAKPLLGMGLAALQGGEMLSKGIATLMYLVASNVNSGNGAWILIECTGGAQQVASPTQSLHAVQLGQFSSSIGASGYQKLPSGVILQWGLATTGASPVAVTFPIAFPSACRSITLGSIYSTSPAGAQITSGFSTTGFSLEMTTFTGTNLAGQSVSWMAIGN